MEENVKNAKVDIKRKYSARKLARNGGILFLAITLGYVHYGYVATLFDNDTNFSNLSELEREMALRTEMGFYYSYYKTVVEERPFIAGITMLIYDKLAEHPTDINAFNRFNIHPEVIIAAIYRYFEPWLNTTAHRQCNMIDRGLELDPIESCIGIGQPIMFYLEAVWTLAGLLVAVIFLHAVMLSDTLLGGMLAVTQYFANHSECTRVQWAPNERENMAAPIFFLQAWLLTMQLRDKQHRPSFKIQTSLFVVNSLCLLFWQFTQFIFLTQAAIIFLMEQFKIIDIRTFGAYLHSQFSGLQMVLLLQHGNDMLKTSLYTSFFLIITVYCLLFSSLRIKVQNRTDLLVESWLVVLRISIVICASFYLKKVISDYYNVEEDSHIWDILYSKFTDFKTFHTLIYTCSAVFDFLPIGSVISLCRTLLIPLVMINSVNVFIYWIRSALNQVKQYYKKHRQESEEDDDDSGIENSAERRDLDVIDKDCKPKEIIEDRLICFVKHLSVDPAIFYNIAQMIVFGVMAALVMRLKLLFVTQMCVVSSLVMNAKYYIKPRSRWIPVFWVACASTVAWQLTQNVTREMSYIGEFTDIQQEQLLKWISGETEPDAAFAGSMPVLATVLLATRRPVVAHPHYEHLGARQRAYSVYKMYGKFSPRELYDELTKLKVSYLIVEKKYCYGRSNHVTDGSSCSFEYIWDVEAPAHSFRPKLCHTLLTNAADHFFRVFQNLEYAVYRVHDLTVSYMPRSFDT